MVPVASARTVSAKASEPMVKPVLEHATAKLLKEEHFLKAVAPIETTDGGMFTEVSEVAS